MFDYVGVSFGGSSTDELYRNKKPVFKGFSLGNELNTLIEDLNFICESLSCAEAVNDLFDSLYDGENDFEIHSPINSSEYRIISKNVIDEIQREELTNDLYILGCFNASFLACLDNMPLDFDTIETMQESEAFEGIGKLIASNKALLNELQEDYASADGYGHHFAHYDHETHEIQINGQIYFVFRTN